MRRRRARISLARFQASHCVPGWVILSFAVVRDQSALIAARWREREREREDTAEAESHLSERSAEPADAESEAHLSHLSRVLAWAAVNGAVFVVPSAALLSDALHNADVTCYCADTIPWKLLSRTEIVRCALLGIANELRTGRGPLFVVADITILASR